MGTLTVINETPRRRAIAPLVSVSITAFNLEQLLPRAIDGVLAQRVSFPVEIVIADDCSTDGTLAVARSYAKKYPEVVRVFGTRENVGSQWNRFEALDRCRGRYTAFLDGDDYWTDPRKLSKQVEILESDSSVSVCAHCVRWVTGTGEVKRDRYPGVASGRYGLEEIIRKNFVPSPSPLFRTGIHRSLPSWYFDLKYLSDWLPWIVAAESGDIVLLDDVMADYVCSPSSIFMSKGQIFWYRSDISFYDHLEDYLPQYRRLIRAEKGKRYEALAYALRREGHLSKSRVAAWTAARSPHLKDNVRSKARGLVAAVVREAQSNVRNLFASSGA